MQIPLILSRLDSIADADLTFAQNPAVEATAVDERLEKSLDAKKVLEVLARKVQPRALKQDAADQELPADKMIERHTLSDDIASRFVRFERNVEVSA